MDGRRYERRVFVKVDEMRTPEEWQNFAISKGMTDHRFSPQVLRGFSDSTTTAVNTEVNGNFDVDDMVLTKEKVDVGEMPLTVDGDSRKSCSFERPVVSTLKPEASPAKVSPPPSSVITYQQQKRPSSNQKVAKSVPFYNPNADNHNNVNSVNNNNIAVDRNKVNASPSINVNNNNNLRSAQSGYNNSYSQHYSSSSDGTVGDEELNVTFFRLMKLEYSRMSADRQRAFKQHAITALYSL